MELQVNRYIIQGNEDFFFLITFILVCVDLVNDGSLSLKLLGSDRSQNVGVVPQEKIEVKVMYW